MGTPAGWYDGMNDGRRSPRGEADCHRYGADVGEGRARAPLSSTREGWTKAELLAYLAGVREGRAAVGGDKQ